MTEDERHLVNFVLWRVRARDLPDDVREAALRIHEHPRPDGATNYAEGSVRVTAFPEDEDCPLMEARPFDVGAHVNGLVAEERFNYILVQPCAAVDTPVDERTAAHP